MPDYLHQHQENDKQYSIIDSSKYKIAYNYRRSNQNNENEE